MQRNGTGRLQVVCGPMFAGKSEELLRRVRRAQLAGLAVEVVNHALDERHGAGQVASHSGLSVPSRSAPDVRSLVELVGGRELDLLAIDEAQFFGTDLVPAVGELVLAGTTVVVAGLCVTFDGRPFEPLPSLMALAEDVTKLTAVCAVCGEDAAFHQRVRHGEVGDSRVPAAEHVGGIEAYQARCRRHLDVRHDAEPA
ncbi:thymidine kinase [Georgenia yuyongxinii]|uniref:Thymidine kinase n=1 Tax=Georgenia yuyongxinii TaxID=2589797 RepID=A0A5B8C260_9MICO|nr:thymidine kinase [Georgenia yuyongxinii]QDC23352.1 thymidine kinase [Georgenia yuyongxinii]